METKDTDKMQPKCLIPNIVFYGGDRGGKGLDREKAKVDGV